jgi:peptide/nickel transport system substrate-binding protein
MIAQQWKAIGIHADTKLFERSLFYNRTRVDENQMSIFSNNGTEALLMFPNQVLPVDPSSAQQGAAIARWWSSNGATGTAPDDPEMLKAFALLRSGYGLPEADRVKVAQEIWRILVDQVWAIGVVGLSPSYMGMRVVNAKLVNVPERTCVSQHCRTPFSSRPDQWYYK